MERGEMPTSFGGETPKK